MTGRHKYLRNAAYEKGLTDGQEVALAIHEVAEAIRVAGRAVAPAVKDGLTRVAGSIDDGASNVADTVHNALGGED